MNLPAFSVRRRVLTTMVTWMVVLLGVVALFSLRIDLLPDIERPSASIRTTYEGAGPEVVERRVTQIIEEIVSSVPGVVELTSRSEQGQSSVTVRFAWGTDLDVAVQDLRARIEDEIDELPDDVGRPRIRNYDINSFPVVILGVSAPLDPVELTQLIEDELRDRFARLPGVAQVDPWGGYNREVRVALDPQRLRALALPLNDVLVALRDANLDLPAGRVERDRFEVAVRAPAEFATLDEVRQTVVARRDGQPVRLGQVATVQDTYQHLDRLVRVGTDNGVWLAIRKQSEANTVEVADAILAEVERIHRDLPQLTVVAVSNEGNFIEQSITNVAWSVAYGGIFAVLVLLFFLRNWRTTALVATAIPVSLLGTFVLLQAGGYTLNLMTLGGLALGVGMMVDSAIVVLENIFHWRERGVHATEAAVEGATEVGPAILASTVTTLVIFLPVIFYEGIAGLLFVELAAVIAFSLLVSLLVSLSVVPMLASRLPQAAEEGRLAQRARSWVAGLEQGYDGVLGVALQRRLATVVLALGTLGLAMLGAPFIDTGFLPPSDEGEVRVTGEMELGTRIDLVDAQTRRIEQVVRDTVPEAIAVVTTVEGGASEDAEGEVRVSLGPTSQRSRSNREVANDLRARLAGTIPGMEIRTRAPQGSFALNRLLGQSEEGITVELRGEDLDTLDALAADVAEVVAAVPGVTDVTDTRPEGIPEERLSLDRAKLADVGLTPRDVAELLEIALAGRQAGEYRVGGDAYRLFVQLADAQRLTLDQILALELTTAEGGRVALGNLVKPGRGEGPISISRRFQRRSVTVTANVAERALGAVAGDIALAIEELPRPAGYTMNLSGAYQAQQETFSQLSMSLALALALVFMVLASQFESYRDPLVVMLSVPFAGVGVVFTLLLTGTNLDLQSGIGCIMLGGIVVNNAILLVDTAGRLRQEGHDPVSAARLAGQRRLRPILMTTLTTLFGLMPLALGLGEGTDAQAPLARAVVGGLAASTVLSLVLIPVVYTFVHRTRTVPGRRQHLS